jgi:hypothetical protein
LRESDVLINEIDTLESVIDSPSYPIYGDETNTIENGKPTVTTGTILLVISYFKRKKLVNPKDIRTLLRYSAFDIPIWKTGCIMHNFIIEVINLVP